MGLVKTRRLAAMQKQQRAKAGRKRCQCGSVASSNVANFQLRIEIGSCGGATGSDPVDTVALIQ